ncbi:MAG: flagellar motor protein MotP [Candidatus Epulonipiscioides saccharophilum]|nr:MAG: flagellar motor protein MotP [Epulopiscium sp. AS2M-Bin001]
MDKGAPLGFLGGLFFIVSSIGLDKVSGFIDIPSVQVVIGGMLSAICIAYPLNRIGGGVSAIKLIFKESTIKPEELIAQIGELAQAARREGLLVLEEKARDMEDPFMQKGIMLMVDGTDPELIRDILETELSFMEDRHKEKQGFWDYIAELGPAWGMIGTLIGLVNMLADLADPSSLGPSMAVALITTFYGSVIANFAAGPVVNKLKGKTAIEVLARQMMIEGLLSIQAGENPRVIEEKLKSFLAPALRGAEEEAA